MLKLALWLLFLVLKGVFLVVGLAVLAFLAWVVNMLYIGPMSDALENMPGPEASKFTSHLAEMMNPNVTIDSHSAYVARYGNSWRFHGFGSFDFRLLTLDLRALQHILNSPIYEKPLKTRRLMSELIGRGIFSMEGAEHKRMRKIITPAFRTGSIRTVAPTFIHKAEEGAKPFTDLTVSDVTASLVNEAVGTTLGTALDVIGVTAFGWDFHAIDEQTDGIGHAYKTMFETVDRPPGLKFFLDLEFPWLKRFWADERNRTLSTNEARINAWGRRVIEDDKRLYASEKYNPSSKDSKRDRTLLRLLVEANAEETDSCARLTDDEILDQMSTFLFGGSDSIATAITWCIHLLSTHSEWQDRLREEVLPIVQQDEDAQIMQLDCSPVLDHVIRESLRIAPPVHSTIRVATKSDRIPLSQPMLKRNGKWEDWIDISKGSFLHIPIEALDCSSMIWGEDANVFNPDRWNNPPQTARSHPGLANVMAFSFGPASCPAYRFAILEIKIFIAVLVSNFVFKPEGSRISRFSSVVSRPNNETPTRCNASLPVTVARYHVQ